MICDPARVRSRDLSSKSLGCKLKAAGSSKFVRRLRGLLEFEVLRCHCANILGRIVFMTLSA